MNLEAHTYSRNSGVETIDESASFPDWSTTSAWLCGAIERASLVRVFSDFKGDGEIMCVLEYDELGL